MNEGVDALLLETYRFPEIEPVLEDVMRALGGAIPVFVSLWQWPDPPEPAASRLLAAGAAVLGLNCQPGAASAVAFAERLSENDERPLAREAGRWHQRPEHAMSPSDLADAVPAFLENHVRLIGGCCGTNEQHLAAVAACARFHRVSLGHMGGDKG